MLWTLPTILLLLWLLGFLGQIGGSMILALPLIALIVQVANFVSRRRAAWETG